MSLERFGPRIITEATVPESLEWDDFAKYLKNVNPEYIDNIQFTFEFAKGAHAPLPPRDTGEKNFSHPLMATIYLAQAGCIHPSHIQACLLHDVPEDNLRYLEDAQNKIYTERYGVNYEAYESDAFEGSLGLYLIESQLDPDTAHIVSAVTKRNSVATTPQGKLQEELDYIEGIGYAPPGALVVKMADRLHNIRTPRPGDRERMLRKHEETKKLYMPAFREALIYFPGEADVLIKEMNRSMHQLERAA